MNNRHTCHQKKQTCCDEIMKKRRKYKKESSNIDKLFILKQNKLILITNTRAIT